MSFVDGAIGANNPVRELVDEVVMLYGAKRRQVRTYTLNYLESSRVTGMVDEVVAALTVTEEVGRPICLKVIALVLKSHIRRES